MERRPSGLWTAPRLRAKQPTDRSQGGPFRPAGRVPDRCFSVIGAPYRLLSQVMRGALRVLASLGSDAEPRPPRGGFRWGEWGDPRLPIGRLPSSEPARST